MISPFTPDELDPDPELRRRRYLAGTPVEELEAGLPFDEECNALFVQSRSRHERTRTGAARGATAADPADAGYPGPAVT